MDTDEHTDVISPNIDQLSDRVAENHESGHSDDGRALTKFSIWKNHLIVCFVSMLLFTASASFEGLQSSLNSNESLGTAGLTLLYVSFGSTTLLMVVFTTSRFSNKRILMVSMVPYILYVCTGFYSSWATIIPTTLLLGIGGGHVKVSMQAYTTTLTKRYSEITNTKFANTNNLFFGISSGFLALRHIWGNLVSSIILLHVPANQTDTVIEYCGIDFCPREVLNKSTIVQPPTLTQLYTYTGILLGFECTAVVIVALFLTDVRDNTASKIRPSPVATIKAVFVHMYRSREQKLLVCVTVYRGLNIAFIQGHFNMAFAACPFGIGYVGLVTIAFGTTSALLSFVVGKVATYTGVLSLFIAAFVAQGSAALTMLFWKLEPDKPEIVFVMIILWGIGDSVISPLVLAMYGTVFDGSLKKTAFSTFYFLVSIGSALAFALASFLCMRATVILMLVCMVMSLAGVIKLNWDKRL